MSLFGGHKHRKSDAEPAAHNDPIALSVVDDQLLLSDQSFPNELGPDRTRPTTGRRPLQNNQRVSVLDHQTHSEAGYEDEDREGEGEEESQDSEHSRPNRFQGPPASWRSWTQNERLLWSSLIQQRDADLSIHLYNAHALKARLYDDETATGLPNWAAKKRWVRRDGAGNKNTTQDSFQPPRLWTAWPLQPELVPRMEEKVKRRWDVEEAGQDEKWTIKMEGKERPSGLLEDVMVAQALKLAKERFLSREWEDEDRNHDQDRTEEEEEEEDDDEADAMEESHSHSDNLETTSKSSTTSQTIRSKAAATPLLSRSPAANPDPSSPGGSRNPEPVISIDDTYSHTLLRPSIRHILSSLDALLLALHQTRSSHRSSSDGQTSRRNSSSRSRNTSNSTRTRKNDTATTTMDGHRRPRHRPRKPLDHTVEIPDLPQNEEDDEMSDPNVGEEDASKQRRKRRGSKEKPFGRPRKYPKPREGESYYFMRRRVAEATAAAAVTEETGKPITSAQPSLEPPPHIRSEVGSHSPSQSPSEPSDSPPSPVRQDRPTRTPRHTSPPLFHRTRFARLNPRDWSEILGIAALIGWDTGALERTQQRVERLLGEKMGFRVLTEDREGSLLSGRGRMGTDKADREGAEADEAPGSSDGILLGPADDPLLQPVLSKDQLYRLRHDKKGKGKKSRSGTRKGKKRATPQERRTDRG
ncbi:MAG: hypothetical protein M1837_002424 [Sclerophora amabilis]|nr:MAG: hypothetical protein M1837_002424 [Sclerophora amabilis]